MKYSITIPAYKSKFLKECLDSVLSQTFEDFEIVVLNDASPEPIEDIVKQYSDKRIRYYRNEKNVGAVDVVDNWNKCLELAAGDYVICIGDDDCLLPNCLEDYNMIIEKYPDLDVYHMRTEIINEDSKIIDLQEDRPDWESTYSFLFHARKSRVNFIGDFCYKRSSLINKGGYVKFPLALASDWVTAEMMAKEKGIANTHIPGFQYRSSQFTITASGNSIQQLEASMQFKQWVWDFLKEEPVSDLDRKYRAIMQEHFEEQYLSGRIFHAARDLSEHPFIGPFRWCFQYRKQFKIPVKYLFLAWIKSLYYIIRY